MSKVNIVNHPKFQKEVLSLLLKDKTFCLKYLSLINRDEDLRKLGFKVLPDRYVNKAVELIDQLYKEDNQDFSEGTLLNAIHRAKDLSVEEKQKLEKLVGECREIANVDVLKIEKDLMLQVRTVKTILMVQDIHPDVMSGDTDRILSIYEKINTKLDSIKKLALSSKNEVDISSPLAVIEEYALDVFSNIPFGIPELDLLLNGGGKFGGIGRGEVTIFISGVNDGKSLSMIGFHSNAINHDFKGIHINLEGKKLQPAMRMISCITKIPYKTLTSLREFKASNPNKTAKDLFTDEQIDSIEKAKDKVKNLRLFHEINNCDVDSICALLRESYMEQRFDYVVIDYASLLTSSAPFARKDEMYAGIFRRLEILAAELNIAVLTPMQVNRSGLLELRHDSKGGSKYPIYTMDMVADSKKAMDTAATVISYSRTQDERSQFMGRFAIIKQREGVTNYQIGIKSDWNICSMFTGERYYTGYGQDEKKETKTGSELKLLTGRLTNDLVDKPKYDEKILEYFNEFSRIFLNIERHKKDIENARVTGVKPEGFDGGMGDYIQNLEDTIDLLKQEIDKKIESLPSEERQKLNTIIMDYDFVRNLVKKGDKEKEFFSSIENCVEYGLMDSLVLGTPSLSGVA